MSIALFDSNFERCKQKKLNHAIRQCSESKSETGNGRKSERERVKRLHMRLIASQTVKILLLILARKTSAIVVVVKCQFCVSALYVRGLICKQSSRTNLFVLANRFLYRFYWKHKISLDFFSIANFSIELIQHADHIGIVRKIFRHQRYLQIDESHERRTRKRW